MRDFSPPTQRQRLAERSFAFREAMGKAIIAALKKLLTEKHLYQYVDVDLKQVAALGQSLNAEALRAEPSASPQHATKFPSAIDELKRDLDSCANVTWAFGGCNISGAMRDVVMFEPPGINTYCEVCKHRPPHNPFTETMLFANSAANPDGLTGSALRTLCPDQPQTTILGTPVPL